MNTVERSRLRGVSSTETDCASCPSSRRCWGEALPTETVQARREPPLERGTRLIEQGEAPGLYIVSSGCLVLRVNQSDGSQRVVGLRLPGELVGLESYAHGQQMYTAQAASPSTVCRLHLPALGTGPAHGALLERLLLKSAAQPDRASAPWAGLPAVERVAAFIENYSQRAHLPAREDPFKLPLTRADIGSYLGLAPETVVRALGHLSQAQRMAVRGRTVRLGGPTR
ncbi:MAG: Crp/Fnr family transcriptional regulator [Steroidobacteraceae bacterium]